LKSKGNASGLLHSATPGLRVSVTGLPLNIQFASIPIAGLRFLERLNFEQVVRFRQVDWNSAAGLVGFLERLLGPKF
jgi:hypothetical protein